MLTDKERMELLNLRKRVQSQREEIKRLRPEWISVKTRLPELHKVGGEFLDARFYAISDLVVTITDNKQLDVCNYEYAEDKDGTVDVGFYTQYGDRADGVTHWMPIPVPPEGG